jgi:GNAT superfamily N-acetyltransferase
MKGSKEGCEPVYSLLGKDDIPQTLRLMEEIKPNICGVHSKSMYRTILKNALRDPRNVFVITKIDSEIVGFYFVVVDRDKWRESFIALHPLILTKTVLAKINWFFRKTVTKENRNSGKIKPDCPVEDKVIRPEVSNRNWKDSSPEIAKLLYIAVKKEYHGKRIGKSMSQYAFKILKERGVNRIDAQILFHNKQSIYLKYKLGFNIFTDVDFLFATRDI